MLPMTSAAGDPETARDDHLDRGTTTPFNSVQVPRPGSSPGAEGMQHSAVKHCDCVEVLG